MKLLLNNKLVKITTADNLTVKQYIALSKYETIDVIRYISATTGREVSHIARIRLKKPQLRRINNYIGKILNIKELEQVKFKSFYFEDEYYSKKLDWQTLGVRQAFEQKAKETNNKIELAIYLLAVLLTENYDASKINENYNKLLDYSYLDTLPFALFFFKKLMAGYRKGNVLLNFLRKIINLNSGRK